MTSTTRLSPPPHLSVKTLAVEVLEGPDVGKKVDAEDELLTIGTAKGNSLVLSDDSVSGYHLELALGATGVEVTDLGSTNGTKFGAAVVRDAVVPLGSTLSLGRTRIRLIDGEGALVAIYGDGVLEGLLGQSPQMRRVMAQIERVATSGVAALLVGESGTGKEVVAQAIHGLSERADGPFVTVDCGAFSPNLVASELFGHERGAFTGAERQRIGAFERADGGTLFLDEVGELPLELQPQLLGALERRRFHRLGGDREIAVDVKVVSATNRDLRNAVNDGSFRLDLYYRLAVLVLRLPPLRERAGDLPILVEHFLRECGHDGPVSDVVPESLMASLEKHSWPGNVRELRNWVEATLAMGEAGELSGAPSRRPQAGDEVLGLAYKEARALAVEKFERHYLGHLIEECDHNVSEAARRARMDRSYLIKLLQRHQLR